jgi:hypothetical protein
MTTTNNGSDIKHLKEKKATSSKQNGNIRGDAMSQASSSAATPTVEEASTEATTQAKSQEPSLEQEFFFGLTIDDALKSTGNLMELFYNACKYNHLELVKRCIEEKNIDINEPINNDYPLCIAW